MNLSIAIPDSALSDEKTLENKTRKISSIARSCGIFRVNEIIIYRDGKNNESDLKLFVTTIFSKNCFWENKFTQICWCFTTIKNT